MSICGRPCTRQIRAAVAASRSSSASPPSSSSRADAAVSNRCCLSLSHYAIGHLSATTAQSRLARCGDARLSCRRDLSGTHAPVVTNKCSSLFAQDGSIALNSRNENTCSEKDKRHARCLQCHYTVVFFRRAAAAKLAQDRLKGQL